jgi:hypothetical protein
MFQIEIITFKGKTNKKKQFVDIDTDLILKIKIMYNQTCPWGHLYLAVICI